MAWFTIQRALFAALLLAQSLSSAVGVEFDQSLTLDQHQLQPVSSETQALLDLHKFLVEIGSVSGNEHAIGKELASFLRAHDFTVELQELPPLESNPIDATRYNIFAYRGKHRKTLVLLTSHIDTVPPFYGYEVRNKTDIWGRGTVDAKGSVAAQISALLSLLKSGDVADGDVALLYVAGEEVGGDGMKAANNLNLTWDSVIFGEPTELKLAEGHKGAMGLEIVAKGKAGHSGYPELGESAISMLLPALVELERIELPSSKKYGNTTLNIGLVEGGVASKFVDPFLCNLLAGGPDDVQLNEAILFQHSFAFVIAERAHASIQIRLAAGTPEESKKKLTTLLNAIDERLELKFRLGYGPVPCDVDIEGFETITVNYGTDIPNLDGSHKRYLYGPGSILVAHSDHEHLSVKELVDASEGYKKLILGALSSTGDANEL